MGDSPETRDNRAAGLVIWEVALEQMGPLQVLVALPESRLPDCPKYTPGKIDWAKQELDTQDAPGW